MIMHVCDICNRNQPYAKIKYKYRAKRAWQFWDENGWEKIELCQRCLYKIIEADKAKSSEKGTCRNIAEDYADVDQFVCSKCEIELRDWSKVESDEDTGDKNFCEYTLKYCPNCGRRIDYDNSR